MDVVARQLVRSGTSVGANYQSAFRARTKRELLAKLGIVEEEADETIWWLDLLGASCPEYNLEITRLQREADELLAMTVASKKTLWRSSGPSGK